MIILYYTILYIYIKLKKTIECISIIKLNESRMIGVHFLNFSNYWSLYILLLVQLNL